MWSMTELTFNFIPGMMVGLEFVNTEEYPEMNWGVVVDLLILRVMLFNWKDS